VQSHREGTGNAHEKADRGSGGGGGGGGGGAVAAGVAAATARVRRNPPPERVRVLAGVRDPIEIRRDAWGIPHVRANTLRDVMCGLGYAMAEDRLWQLDILHRVGVGRLAEVVGEAALDSDKFMRSVGLGRASAAEAACLEPDGDTRLALEGFSDGVNGFVASRRLLGGEFVVGRYRPLAWTPAASIVSLKLMGWSQNSFLEKLLLRDRVAAVIGEEWAALAVDGEQTAAAGEVVVPPAMYAELRARLDSVHTTLEEIGGMPQRTTPGSNSWVVAGSHTATGKPLFANDPHLAFTLPSLWYECHLTAPGLNAAGATIPGVPGIAIGHNDHAAWGITATMLVQTELYIEEFDPDEHRRLSYRVGEQWVEADRFMDVIPVKGREAEAHETLVTRHGPVIAGHGPMKGDTRALAVKWVGQEAGDEMTGLLALMRAESVDALHAACVGFAIPSVNLVFADDAGHIGYQYVGRVPIRPAGCGTRPVPGWTNDHEWQGYIPFADLPFTKDPAEGFIATANTRIPDNDYPYPLPSVYVAPFRQRRIRQLLAGRDGLTLDDMRRMQADTYDLHAEPLRPIVLGVLDRAARQWSEPEATARELLRAWDGFADAESAGSAIWHVFAQQWMRRVLRARMDEELADEMMNIFLGAAHWALPDRLLARDDVGWFPDTTREAAIITTFIETTAWLVEKLGAYPVEWEWSAVHAVTFRHPVALGAKAMARFVNIGPYPMGGDCNTVNNAYWNLKEPYDVINGASYRIIVDLARASRDDGALACNTAGNSGGIGSHHYRDQTNQWLRVRYHPLGTDAASVAARTSTVLRLLPESTERRG